MPQSFTPLDGEEVPNASGWPKYPDVVVQLVGNDGNAFSILGAVSNALRKAGHGDAVATFQSEAMTGDYDSLLGVCMAWVTVE